MAGDRTQIIAGWCVQRMQHMNSVAADGRRWRQRDIGLPRRFVIGTTTAPGRTAVKDHFKRLFRFDDRSQYTTARITKATAAPFLLRVLWMPFFEPGKVINWNGKSVKITAAGVRVR